MKPLLYSDTIIEKVNTWLLEVRDLPENRIRPIVIIGGPGSGKSVLASALAMVLSVGRQPYVTFSEVVDHMSIARYALRGNAIFLENVSRLRPDNRDFLCMIGLQGQSLVIKGKLFDDEARMPLPVPVIITSMSKSIIAQFEQRPPYSIELPMLKEHVKPELCRQELLDRLPILTVIHEARNKIYNG